MPTERLEKLKTLEKMLFDSMQVSDEKALPGLAKQYRETLREIEALEGNAKGNDEIEELLGSRRAAGKSKPVRKNRAAVQ